VTEAPCVVVRLGGNVAVGPNINHALGDETAGPELGTPYTCSWRCAAHSGSLAALVLEPPEEAPQRSRVPTCTFGVGPVSEELMSTGSRCSLEDQCTLAGPGRRSQTISLSPDPSLTRIQETTRRIPVKREEYPRFNLAIRGRRVPDQPGRVHWR
jgi:hypothetical protein